jgi:hypothetical protein
MSAVALTGSLPLVARFVCALLLVNCPSQPLAKSNERSPVSQLERNLASLSVDSGVGVGFARSLDDPYATHLAQSHQRTAQTGRWFPRSTGDARALTELGPQGAFNLLQIGRRSFWEWDIWQTGRPNFGSAPTQADEGVLRNIF